jgi:hypothetical protein
MSELTRAERIRENAFLDIICPSGNEYRVRKGGPRDNMLLLGKLAVDEALLADWIEEARDALNAPPEIQNEETERELLMIQTFCRDWVEEPKIIGGGKPGPDEVTMAQVGADVYHLMAMWTKYCMGNLKAEDLQFFRSGICGGEFGQAGTEVREITPRVDGAPGEGSDD